MPRFGKFVIEKNTYPDDEDFAWAIWKERETLIEAVSSLEARIAELEAECEELAALANGYQLNLTRYQNAIELCAKDEWNRGIYGPARQVTEKTMINPTPGAGSR